MAAEPSLREMASMSQSAISRALGELQSVRLAEAGAGVAARIAGDADSSATRAARAAQAGTVVTGSVYPLGADSVRLDLRVLDANSGDLVRALRPLRVARGASDSAWTAALDPLLATVAITTFPWLGARALPVGDPPRFAAVRELLTSFAFIARGDSDSRAAMQLHSTRVILLDDTFLQGQLWRAAEASTVVSPGYSVIGRAMMDTAILVVGAQRDRLSPFELTLFDYVSAVRHGDQGAMLAALRRLQDIAPDAVLARNLPNRLLDVNRPREALALLLHARPTRDLDGKVVLPSESPLRWATLADVYHYLGDHRAEHEAAAQMRRLRPDNLLSIRYQLKAAAALHDSAEVERLLADARPLPSPAETYDFFGDLELQAGQELEAHGQVAFGRSLVRRAIEWFEAQPPAERTWRMRVRHATAYHELQRRDPRARRTPDGTRSLGQHESPLRGPPWSDRRREWRHSHGATDRLHPGSARPRAGRREHARARIHRREPRPARPRRDAAPGSVLAGLRLHYPLAPALAHRHAPDARLSPVRSAAAAAGVRTAVSW